MAIGPEFIIENMPHLAGGIIPEIGTQLVAQLSIGEKIKKLEFEVRDMVPATREVFAGEQMGRLVWKDIQTILLTVKSASGHDLNLWLDEVQSGQAGALTFPQYQK